MSDERQLKQSSLPHTVLQNGSSAELCGAQTKNDPGPCRTPREECLRHCGSNLKSKPGERCPTPPMLNGRCRMHGGRSLTGVESPRWRHGRRSKLTKVLSGTDLETFEEVLADPAYIEMREQMAYLKVRFYDAVERAQVGRSNELWDELAIQWGLFSNPGPEKAPERSAGALREIGRLIREGAAAHRAAIESMDIIERQRKVAESERKRISDEQQTISVARALAFAGSVFALMRQALAEHIGGTQEERLILATVHAGIAERIRADVDGRRAG